MTVDMEEVVHMTVVAPLVVEHMTVVAPWLVEHMTVVALVQAVVVKPFGY